jgi:hypothetical protein
MHPKKLYGPACFADRPGSDDRAPLLDLSPQEASFPVTKRATLIVVLALSLGLWAVIWAGLASLASAAFG